MLQSYSSLCMPPTTLLSLLNCGCAVTAVKTRSQTSQVRLINCCFQSLCNPMRSTSNSTLWCTGMWAKRSIYLKNCISFFNGETVKRCTHRASESVFVAQQVVVNRHWLLSDRRSCQLQWPTWWRKWTRTMTGKSQSLQPSNDKSYWSGLGVFAGKNS